MVQWLEPCPVAHRFDSRIIFQGSHNLPTATDDRLMKMRKNKTRKIVRVNQYLSLRKVQKTSYNLQALYFLMNLNSNETH